MNNESLITVLCSTYNSSKWIEGYLEMINKQFLENFDIIFVDANSTDGSLDTIRNFKFRQGINSKIIACNSKIPIYTAWNMAIENSKTPYVVNVNTDDRLLPAALLVYTAYTEQYPDADVIYSGYIRVKDVEHTISDAFWSMPPDHTHEQLLSFCYCGPFPLLKKNSVIEDGMFNPNYTISGDYEMWLRMSKNGRKFVRVAELIGSYFWNPVGMSTSLDNRNEALRQDAEVRRIHA